MIPIIDFERRSIEGPSMTASEFDDKLMYAAMDMGDDFDLDFDWKNQILADDDRANEVFAAAQKFLAEIGVYNRTATRVIQWTEDEIKDLVKDYRDNPRELVVGAGKEQYTIKGRHAEDGNAPVIWAGGGPLFNIQFIEPSMTAFTREPAVKGFTKAGGLSNLNGMDSRAGCPSELVVQLAETEEQLRVLKKLGREGMFLGNLNSPAPVAGALCVRPGRYDPKQIMLGVHIAPEQKLDWTRLQAAITAEDLGVTPWSSAMSMVGGLAGGPGGAAMCATANLLAQLSYAHGTWCSVGMNDMQGSSKTAMVLSAYSAVIRAATNNLNISIGVPCCDSTESTCFEEGIIAATLIAMVASASGAVINWFGGTSPLTVRIHDDVMRNVSKMKTEEVEPIIHNTLDLLAKVRKEHEGQKKPFGTQLFFAIYDVNTLEPHPDYREAVESSVRMMKEVGVPISDSLSLD